MPPQDRRRGDQAVIAQDRGKVAGSARRTPALGGGCRTGSCRPRARRPRRPDSRHQRRAVAGRRTRQLEQRLAPLARDEQEEGRMTQVTDGDVEPGEVAAQLHLVLAAIDAEEVEAAPNERAYLAGAAGTLDALTAEGIPPLAT